MKANKALKRLSKIQTLISDVEERYSAGGGNIRKLLEQAREAVARVDAAVKQKAGEQAVKRPEVKAAAKKAGRAKGRAARRKSAAKPAAPKSVKVSGPARKRPLKAAGGKSKEAATGQSAYW